SVGLHDQFGISHAIIEPRHAAASNDLRAGRQHRPSADASDNSASSADVLDELGYAWIFGKQGRTFCTTWNEDAHIVLGPGFRYRTVNVQQAGSREIAVNLDRLLARGHHLDLVASLIEGDLGKEVLLLLKRVRDQSGNLWTSVGHCVVSCVSVSIRTVSLPLEKPPTALAGARTHKFGSWGGGLVVRARGSRAGGRRPARGRSWPRLPRSRGRTRHEAGRQRAPAATGARAPSAGARSRRRSRPQPIPRPAQAATGRRR